LDAGLTSLLCKKIIVAKSKEVKTGCNLAESCKEGCGSKRDVFPMMMMIIMMIFDSFTAVPMKTVAFWDVTPAHIINRLFQRFYASSQDTGYTNSSFRGFSQSLRQIPRCYFD
jgi:hypothetical protein